MGAITDKLSYLEETRTQIAQAITDKGVSVAGLDTFRSYAEKIQQIDTAKPEQVKSVSLNMASGNQIVVPDEGKALSSVTIEKPTTMLPENIKRGVSVGGVVGTLEEGSVIPTYEGSYTITENGTIPLAGKKAAQDFVVSVPSVVVKTGLKPSDGQLTIPTGLEPDQFRNIFVFCSVDDNHLGQIIANGYAYLFSFRANDFDILETDQIIKCRVDSYMYGSLSVGEHGMLATSTQLGISLVMVDQNFLSTDVFTYTAVIW